MPRSFLVFLLIVCAGCSGPLVRNAPDASAPADFPNHTSEQVAFQLATGAAALHNYRSEGRLNVTTPTLSQGAGISLRATLVDSLYAKLRGPLNIEVATLLITGDSILVHDKLSRKYYYGPLSVADKYVAGGDEPGLLSQTLIGMIVPTVTHSTIIESDSVYYYISVVDASGRVRERWTIDPALWRVVEMEGSSSDGTVETQRTFSSFDVVDGIVLPRRVELSSPAQGISIVVEHQQLSPNPESLSFPFSRPRDVEFILLE